MKKILRKVRAELNLNILKISAILVAVFYGINFTIEYATDTYSTFQEADTWKWMLYENGRVFNAILYYLIEKLQIPNGYIYKLSYLLALCCLILATYIFAKLLNEFCSNEFICSAVSFLTLSNFFIIEYFLFIEKGLFMLALLLCTLAAYFTVQFFKKKEKFCLFPALILLLGAVFIYQLLLALYVILCLPFILKYSSDLKNFIANNLLVASLYGVPLLFGFLITKFALGSSRMGKIGNIFVNLFNQIPMIIKISTEQWQYLPEYFFAGCLLSVLILYLICIIFLKRSHTYCCSVGVMIYLILGTVFTSFFPFITGICSIYSPRTLYPYGCLWGILLVYIIIYYYKNFNLHFSFVLIMMLTTILAFHYLTFSSVFIERYKANQTDKYYSEIIGTKIKEYETETNITIDTICFYHDIATTWFDHGCDETHMNTRAQSCGWSNLTALNLYLDTNYIKGDPLPEYEEYFSQYNWDTYSDKQVIFNKNTLHLCIY